MTAQDWVNLTPLPIAILSGLVYLVRGDAAEAGAVFCALASVALVVWLVMQ